MEEIQNTPIIYVVGPALSGNTTLGRNFQGRGFTWLEMSEIIRDRVKKDPIFREYAENVSAIGNLLPDKIMNTLFRDRVRNISTRTIVTGYPITEGQGYFAFNHAQEKGYDPLFVIIQASSEVCEKRASPLGCQVQNRSDDFAVRESRDKMYDREIVLLEKFLLSIDDKQVLFVDGEQDEQTILVRVSHL